MEDQTHTTSLSPFLTNTISTSYQDPLDDMLQQLSLQLMDARRQEEESIHALTLFDNVNDIKKEQMIRITSTDDEMQNLNNMMHIMMHAHKKSVAMATHLRITLKRVCGFIAALEKRKLLLLNVTQAVPPDVVFASDVRSPESRQAAIKDAIKRIETQQRRLKDIQTTLQKRVRDLIRVHLGAFAAFQNSLGETFHCDMVEDLLS